VIVSDDSREELAPRVREVVERFPGVRYLRGPRAGLGANRNLCLRHASGTLVSYVDDDVVLHPDFLDRGPKEFDRLCRELGTDRILLTGNQIMPWGLSVPSNISFLGFYTGRLPDDEKPNAICINSTFFPARLFRETKFDENYRFGSEEVDISFEAAHLGYRIVYRGDLTNYHNQSDINRDLYSKVVLQSRVYFGLKRYWIYKRSLGNFVLFNLYAFANAVGHCLKHLRFRDSISAVAGFGRAWRMFVLRLRQDARNVSGFIPEGSS
jgi:glycosyltransferase involved in cell wall biosynthesis